MSLSWHSLSSKMAFLANYFSQSTLEYRHNPPSRPARPRLNRASMEAADAEKCIHLPIVEYFLNFRFTEI